MEKVSEYYKKYTGVIYSVLFILGAILIIFVVIMPSLSSIGNLQNEAQASQKTLVDYKNSASLLKNFDDKQLSTQMDLVTRVIPPSKDIQAIYLALTQSAAVSNISVRGFTVQAGDVFQKSTQKPQADSGIPFVKVNVNLSGVNLDTLSSFITSLSKQFPLSKVALVNVAQGEVNMDINFYYKPYDLSLIDRSIVSPLSSSEEGLMKQLAP